MTKDFGARYNGHDVVLSVGESVACRSDGGHVFFNIPIMDIRLAVLAGRTSFRLNWQDGRKVINALVKSGHSARIVQEIRLTGTEANE